MWSEAEVSDHYTNGGLLDAVRAAHQIGKPSRMLRSRTSPASMDPYRWPARPWIFSPPR